MKKIARNDLIISFIIILVFNLIGRILSSVVGNHILKFVLIFEVFPLICVIICYIYRGYSFKGNLGLIILSLMNIVSPLYCWFVFNICNDFTYFMLLYTSEILRIFDICYWLLCMVIIWKHKIRQFKERKNAGDS